MGVTSGWVGSSAKSETGEQWMGAAGTKLGLSKPFMMSQMVGRTMGCKIATEYYKWKSSDKVDNWGAVGADWPLEEKSKGTITNAASCGSGRLVGAVVTLSHFLTSSTPTAAVYLAGGKAGNITVNVGGATQTMIYQGVVSGFQYYWSGSVSSAFVEAMKKTGVPQDLKIS